LPELNAVQFLRELGETRSSVGPFPGRGNSGRGKFKEFLAHASSGARQESGCSSRRNGYRLEKVDGASAGIGIDVPGETAAGKSSDKKVYSLLEKEIMDEIAAAIGQNQWQQLLHILKQAGIGVSDNKAREVAGVLQHFIERSGGEISFEKMMSFLRERGLVSDIGGKENPPAPGETMNRLVFHEAAGGPGEGNLKNSGSFKQQDKSPELNENKHAGDEESSSMNKVNPPAGKGLPGNSSKLINSGFKNAVDVGSEIQLRGKLVSPGKDGNENSQQLRSDVSSKTIQLHDLKPSLPAVDEPHESFIARLAQVLKEQMVDRGEFIARNGRSEVRLQLKPEYLGKLQLQLTLEKGAIHARILVENHQIRHLIENNLPYLKQSLEEQGISWQQASVDIGSFGSREFLGGRQYFEGRDEPRIVEQAQDIEISTDSAFMTDRNFFGGSISYLA